ncbi:MAG: porin [Cycloclasticus sp.]|nr:porin [Cycloclasticus sp.]MBQ0790787.1 porin [Cycloclasticus sp.]
MKTFKTSRLVGLSLATVALTVSSAAFSANWLMLQGTEKPGSTNPANLWGFIQAQYQEDFSDKSATNQYIPPKLIGPMLDDQSEFNINRARIGLRGVATAIDDKINYFLLAEFGRNGITYPNKSDFVTLTDASVTFNHIKGARIRAGLFKTPGAEEGLQAIHVFDYVNFTSVTNQMLLERYPNKRYTANIGAQPLSGKEFGGFEESVGAFRDVGIQVFDNFKVSDGWELSYAAMYGNGNGLNFNDNDDNKDLYFYLSAEKVFGGKGPKRDGLKIFAWSQDGERTADLTNDMTHNPDEYDRERRGLGIKYLNKPWRVTAEYMEGDGMIFLGPHQPSFGQGPGQGNPNAAAGVGAKGEAEGYYVEMGYRIPKTKIELDLRFDNYVRMKGDMFETEFDKITVGAQYFFTKTMRLAVNYEKSDAEATKFAGGAGPNAQLDGVDDRIAIQFTAIFP